MYNMVIRINYGGDSMLDRRYETFLSLAKTHSYTKTAANLFITQPAVTQQIASLQKELDLKLVNYDRPKLTITPAGQKLAAFIENVNIQSNQMLTALHHPNKNRSLHFGATLSLNAIVEPAFINQIQAQYANIDCLVANTSRILHDIDSGQIEFGLVEGNFDLSGYAHLPLFQDEFIAVANSANPLAQQKYVTLSQCLTHTLLLREVGSGTRSILENWLQTSNRTVTDFSKMITIGDMMTIIKLLLADAGISFMYRSLILQELDDGTLVQLPLRGFQITRSLSMVFPHHAYYKKEYQQLAQLLKQLPTAPLSHE